MIPPLWCAANINSQLDFCVPISWQIRDTWHRGLAGSTRPRGHPAAPGVGSTAHTGHVNRVLWYSVCFSVLTAALGTPGSCPKGSLEVAVNCAKDQAIFWTISKHGLSKSGLLRSLGCGAGWSTATSDYRLPSLLLSQGHLPTLYIMQEGCSTKKKKNNNQEICSK